MEIGYSPDFSSNSEKILQLRLLARVMADIMRDIQPRSDRFQVRLSSGTYRYKLPQGVLSIQRVYLDTVDITSAHVPVAQIQQPEVDTNVSIQT